MSLNGCDVIRLPTRYNDSPRYPLIFQYFDIIDIGATAALIFITLYAVSQEVITSGVSVRKIIAITTAYIQCGKTLLGWFISFALCYEY